MTNQLAIAEINTFQKLLQDNEAAQKALSTLEKNNGNLEASFDALWLEKFGRIDMGKGQSLLKLTLEEIRADICGDEGLREKIKEYSKNPGNASLLNTIIGSLVAAAAVHGLPLDGTIITILVLYILKLGLNVYCKYIEADDTEKESK